METNTLSWAKEQAKLFRIFGNSRRILIFYLLLEHELSVGEIADQVGASMQNTSQHLRLMKDKGIVSSRRDGQTIYYRIPDNQLSDCCKRMFQAYSLEQAITYQ
jgi:ArsR family transcriptional regulator